MKVFEDSTYKEQEKVESLEKELDLTKTSAHELEEKYADVSQKFYISKSYNNNQNFFVQSYNTYLVVKYSSQKKLVEI